ncbi:MAG: hypothetical protein AAGD40_10520, partial [Pseudomonadota bacterium]
MRRVLLFVFALLPMLVGTGAHAASTVQNPYTRVELLAGPAQNGARTAVIRMTPKAGWHTYWENPGGAGLKTRPECKLDQITTENVSELGLKWSYD